MKTSEAIEQLVSALAQARPTFDRIARNKTVEVKTSNGKYDFSYATLDVVLESCVTALGQAGLALVSGVEAAADGSLIIVTRLCHSSGQWIESSLPVGKASKLQEMGSLITYGRRYLISALLSIAPDEDDDGNGADGNAIVSQTSRPASPSGDALNNPDESIRVKNPPVTSTNGDAPTAGGHVALDQIDALFALAESCQEPKEVFGTTLRRIMGLGDEVRITKKYLRERMDMQIYDMARLHYEQLLRRQVEDDVPDGTPPQTGDVSTPTPVAEVEA